MTMVTDRLEAAHIKQLLLYAPDDDEVKRYEQYADNPNKLSEPDQFVLQVIMQINKSKTSVGCSLGRKAVIHVSIFRVVIKLCICVCVHLCPDAVCA